MINFPSSPVNGQVFTAGDFSWMWNSASATWTLRAQFPTGPTGPTGATGPGVANSISDSVSPYNTAFGYQAMNGVSPAGLDNVAIGHEAGKSLTSGATNVAIGYQALFTTTTATDAIAIGNLAGTANNSTGIVAVGYWAMKANTSGGDVAIGYASMYSNTTGTQNVAVGSYALRSNTTGYDNTAIGYYALSASNGRENTAIGWLAGYSTSTGIQNTSLGANAGRGNTTGSNNACIGYYAVPPSTTTSNSFTLGNASITNLRCNDTTISSLSDARDKSNIQNIPLGLDYIKALRPVMFDWNRRPIINEDGDEIINEVFVGRKDFGFIAQELDTVQETFGYEEYTRLVHKDNPDMLEADPMKTYPILVKAVQELAAQVAELQSRVGN
jgi:hypothetical protein